MLTAAELAALESLLTRARIFAGIDRAAGVEVCNVGDVAQLRPGADAHWQTSLLLVEKIRDNGDIAGTVLRPHRSGAREAWYTYSAPELTRIGASPFPRPGAKVRSQSYLGYCPKCLRRE